MELGLEVAALAVLPFAAAMGVGAGLASLDSATGWRIGGWLTFVFAIVMVPLTFYFLIATFATAFRTEVLAIAPLTALVGVLVGYGLGRSTGAKAPRRSG